MQQQVKGALDVIEGRDFSGPTDETLGHFANGKSIRGSEGDCWTCLHRYGSRIDNRDLEGDQEMLWQLIGAGDEDHCQAERLDNRY